MQVKNSGGAWANIGTAAGAAQKATLLIAATAPPNSAVNLNLDAGGVTSAEGNARVDVFVNGQLLRSGSIAEVTAVPPTSDYYVDGDLSAATDIKFAFALVADDIVTGIVR